MKTETSHAAISSATDADTGEVTLYISNKVWCPVVTGKDLAEAKEKMRRAFGLAMIANSFCSFAHANGLNKSKAQQFKQELSSFNRTLEYVL